MEASQIITPPWQDKALWLAVLTPLLTALSNKLGVQLDSSAVVALVVPVVVYIAAHKWKTTTLAKALIAADNPPPSPAAPVIPLPAGPITPPKAGGYADVRAAGLFALFSGVGAVLAVMLCLWCSTAHAATLNLDQSQPAIIIHPGEPHPVSLLPGAGLSIGADLLPSTLLGVPVHLLSVGGDVFGSVVAALTVAGAASVALHVILAELLVLMVGLDLYRTSDGTGLFASTFTGHDLFVGVGIDPSGLLRRLLGGHSPAVIQAPPAPAGAGNAPATT